MRTRSKFIPSKWTSGVLLSLLVTSLTFGLYDNIINNPATANVISKVGLGLGLTIYLLWVIFNPAIRLKFRLALLALLFVLGSFSYTQYRISGWSGYMMPYIERISDQKRLTLKLPKDFLKESSNVSTPIFSQFMGNERRDGIVLGERLNGNWEENPPKELWRIKVGEGLSGFAVQGDYAIITEQRGESECVVCYDTLSGQVRWCHSDRVRHESILGGVGPRATVTIDKGKVYAIGGAGYLSCLNLRDGKRLWQKKVLEEIGLDQIDDSQNVAWGRSGAPLLTDKLVVVPGGGHKGACVSLLAYDKETGELVWKAGDQQISYASPQRLVLDGVEQIVTVNESSVSGHDLIKGHVLWQIDFYGKSSGAANTAQVCLVNDRHFILSKSYNGGCRLIRVVRDQGHWETKVIWKNRGDLRTKFSSSIKLNDKTVVGLNERDLQALDPMTGQELWVGKRYGYGQILRYNDKLFVLTEAGVLALVHLENGEEIARLPILTGKTWCPLAIAGDLVFARNNDEAVCYRLPMMKE